MKLSKIKEKENFEIIKKKETCDKQNKSHKVVCAFFRKKFRSELSGMIYSNAKIKKNTKQEKFNWQNCL